MNFEYKPLNCWIYIYSTDAAFWNQMNKFAIFFANIFIFVFFKLCLFWLQMAYSSGSLNLQEELDPKKEEKEGSVREVGDQAVWSLSSCKAGILSVDLKIKGHINLSVLKSLMI